MSENPNESFYVSLLYENIRSIHNQVKNEMTVYASKQGLTYPSFLILSCINKQVVTNQSGICKHSNLKKHTVSRQMKSLEQKKFISRRIDESDKKQLKVSLTHCGTIVIENLLDYQQEMLEIFLSQLNESDVVSIVERLAKVTGIQTPIQSNKNART